MTLNALPLDHAERMARARLSLEGLAVGDAFGEWFFAPQSLVFLSTRQLPPKPWHYTDDTAMAISIFEILDQFGGIQSDALAERFARRYTAEPHRGYGAMAQRILRMIASGVHWAEAGSQVFGGDGSMGNGGAMRVGPVGAYFADDLAATAEHARLSAQVTHAHPEGQAGAVAVATAVACAAELKGDLRSYSASEMLETVIRQTPEGMTHAGLVKALALGFDCDVRTAASALGNGSQLTASDTVPFAIWCAARHLDDFERALWTTVSASGDMDTNCAIVGSIVAMATGMEGIPELWRRSRESPDIGVEL